jgi:histidinol phosphatase-like PHP family hydrolase
MNPERSFMPIINSDQIGPELKLTDEKREKQKEKREEEDSLSKYISRWWKGDAHTHSKESSREDYGYTEGVYDVKEALKYYEGLRLEFACFAEHASKPGTPEKQSSDSEISQSLIKGAERITQINREKQNKVAAFSGVETNIMYDEKSGQPILDIPDEILQKLDLVIASRHAISREKELEAIKETLLFAIRNQHIDVIGHPDRYAVDDNRKNSPEYLQEYNKMWSEILEEMAKNGKAFEINLNNLPSKELVEMAVKKGVKFFINYDAHDFSQYKKEDKELFRPGEEAKSRWGKGEATLEDMDKIEEYKKARLSAGPGYRAISKLVRQIQFLESLGLTPVKSSQFFKRQFIRFFD